MSLIVKKEDLWTAYVKANPHWETRGADLTPDSIRKLFDKTWEYAHAAGLEEGRAIAAHGRDVLSEMMDRIRVQKGK